jgi:hypothetical protein
MNSKQLTQSQQHWLARINVCQQQGISMKDYAQQQGIELRALPMMPRAACVDLLFCIYKLQVILQKGVARCVRRELWRNAARQPRGLNPSEEQ